MRRAVSIEAQLQTLLACGVRLSHGYTSRTALDAVMQEATRSELESQPYRRMLAALGTEEEPIAENVWHFSPTSITGPWSYVRIAQRLSDMTDGGFPLLDLAEELESDQSSRLSFHLDGEPHELRAHIDGARVDFVVIRRLNELLEGRHPSKRFFFLDVDDQPVIACLTADGRSRLGRETGVQLEWCDVLSY